jgi:hypothetical protein
MAITWRNALGWDGEIIFRCFWHGRLPDSLCATGFGWWLGGGQTREATPRRGKEEREIEGDEAAVLAQPLLTVAP